MTTAVDTRPSAADRYKKVPRPPALTSSVFAVTVVVSVAALLNPRLMSACTRDLDRLRAGQWWRVLTPVLVQPDGWGQLAFNMLGLVVVGTALQRLTGRLTWLAIYAVGGVGSVAVEGAWHPSDTGGGSSAAVAAVIGSLAVVRLAANGGQSRLGWLAELYSVFFVVYLAAFAVGGLVPSVVAGNASIVLVVVAHQALRASTVSRIYVGVVLVGAVLLCAVKDDHGAGLVVGALITALVLAHRRLRDGVGVSRPGLLVLAASLGVTAASLLTWVAWVHLLGVSLVVRASGGGTTEVGWPAVVAVSVGACLAAYEGRCCIEARPTPSGGGGLPAPVSLSSRCSVPCPSPSGHPAWPDCSACTSPVRA